MSHSLCKGSEKENGYSLNISWYLVFHGGGGWSPTIHRFHPPHPQNLVAQPRHKSISSLYFLIYSNCWKNHMHSSQNIVQIEENKRLMIISNSLWKQHWWNKTLLSSRMAFLNFGVLSSLICHLGILQATLKTDWGLLLILTFDFKFSLTASKLRDFLCRHANGKGC